MIRWFFLFLTVWISFPTVGQARDARSEAGIALVRALADMGYTDITLEKCELAFSRYTEPTDANNGLRKYTRFVHIDTLDLRQVSRAERVAARGQSFFIVRIPFTNTYLDGVYLSYEMAVLRVREALKSPDWPAPGPGFYGENAVSGQILLKKILLEQYERDISEYNRWVNYTSLGAITHIPPNFQITYFESGPLEVFSESIVSYSSIHQCASKT